MHIPQESSEGSYGATEWIWSIFTCLQIIRSLHQSRTLCFAFMHSLPHFIPSELVKNMGAHETKCSHLLPCYLPPLRLSYWALWNWTRYWSCRRHSRHAQPSPLVLRKEEGTTLTLPGGPSCSDANRALAHMIGHSEHFQLPLSFLPQMLLWFWAVS